jgi:hypothetical protein
LKKSLFLDNIKLTGGSMIILDMTMRTMLERVGGSEPAIYALHLLGMGILMVLWVVMITRIGRAGKAAAEKGAQPVISAPQRGGSNNAVTAAITAAVTEFRKKK